MKATPFSTSFCRSKTSARRGSRCASPGKNNASRKRPASAGSSLAIASPSSHPKPDVREAKRLSSPTSRGGATTRVPLRDTSPGSARSHQSMAPMPRVSTVSSALSRSHQGASMPPANHDAAPPKSGCRSATATSTPRPISSCAKVSPTTPAPLIRTRMVNAPSYGEPNVGLKEAESR
ncbi:hypothetical protein D9M72_451880 [compost metagenome]